MSAIFPQVITASDVMGLDTALSSLMATANQVGTNTITRLASDASGTQTIALPFQPAFVLFSFVDSADVNANSDGWDDGTVATCSSIFSSNVLTSLLGAVGLVSLSTKSQTVSIWVQSSSGNGHQAKITSKSGSGFTLTWTRLGSGRNISGRFLAVQ